MEPGGQKEWTSFRFWLHEGIWISATRTRIKATDNSNYLKEKYKQTYMECSVTLEKGSNYQTVLWRCETEVETSKRNKFCLNLHFRCLKLHFWQTSSNCLRNQFNDHTQEANSLWKWFQKVFFRFLRMFVKTTDIGEKREEWLATLHGAWWQLQQTEVSDVAFLKRGIKGGKLISALWS